MQLADNKVRRLVLVVLGLALAALADGAAAQWLEHRAAAEGYRAEFPSRPEASQQEVQTPIGPVRLSMRTATWSGLSFLTVYNAYPNDVAPERRLDGARDGAVRNVRGILREERVLTVSGAPARRIIVDVPQQQMVAVQLLVVRNNRLYQAIVVGPVGTEASAHAARFINSFALDPL